MLSDLSVRFADSWTKSDGWACAKALNPNP